LNINLKNKKCDQEQHRDSPISFSLTSNIYICVSEAKQPNQTHFCPF